MKNVRSLIVGLIAGVLLATAGSAFAAPVLQKVSAVLRPDYTIKVDGKTVDMRHAPLSYNGTTYVPLREAGEILGRTVGYDSGTITIDSASKGADSDVNETTTVNDNATNVDSGDWIALSDLRKTMKKITLGPSEYDQNTLTIENNGVTIHILNLVNPDGKDKITHQLHEGGSIDIIYTPNGILLDAAKLRELGILNQ